MKAHARSLPTLHGAKADHAVTSSRPGFLRKDPGALGQETDMLDKVKRAVAPAQRAAPLDVAMLSVATAVPPHVLSQADIAARALMISPQFARLDSLYANTGIE